MQLAYHPIILPFIASGIITAILAGYAMKRPGTAAKTFVFLMFALTIWTLCYVMELSSVTLEGKCFWLKLKYLGSGSGPAIWLIFSLHSTNNERLLKRPLYVILWLWVGVTWLIVLTNDYHHWMWADFTLVTGRLEMQTKHGAYFVIYAVSVYILNITSVLFYFKYLQATPLFFRRQASLLVLGGFIPMGSRIPKDFFGIELFPKVDEVIFLLLISGILFALALFRYGALNIVHIAHKLVVQNISAGIIVVDLLGRVVEVNPYAQTLFGVTNKRVVGKAVEEIVPDWPDFGGSAEQGKEYCLQRGDQQAYFFTQSSEIKKKRRPGGRLHSGVVRYYRAQESRIPT